MPTEKRRIIVVVEGDVHERLATRLQGLSAPQAAKIFLLQRIELEECGLQIGDNDLLEEVKEFIKQRRGAA